MRARGESSTSGERRSSHLNVLPATPSLAADPDYRDWLVNLIRLGASPAGAYAFNRMMLETLRGSDFGDVYRRSAFQRLSSTADIDLTRGRSTHVSRTSSPMGARSNCRERTTSESSSTSR